MGQFLPDNIYPMAGLRTKANCYMQLFLLVIIIPACYVLYLISRLFS